jgi:hypothetical protein
MAGINIAGINCQKVPLGQGIGKTSIEKPMATIATTNSHCLFEMEVGTPL